MHSLIHLQDPNDGESPSVLEAILEDCKEATEGGGMFAFASPAGVSMLFRDEVFQRFTKRAPFDLIVGVDSITNESVLKLLKSHMNALPSLSVSVFLHARQVTFHPKFCWFRTRVGARLIVGSGNLTPGGLSGNWEAFFRHQTGRAETEEVALQWKRWKERNAKYLLAVDDPVAITRAQKNKPRIVRAPDSEEAPLAAVSPEASPDEVLIAEIPKGADRWQQANFDIETFERFFHLKRGTPRRVLLWHLRADGTLSEAEVRQSVSVKSKNYRIELGAAPKQDYPTDGRPISVFLRTGTRKFRYHIVMPSDAGYPAVLASLDKRWVGRADRMRRVQLSPAELVSDWPENPVIPDRGSIPALGTND